MIVAAAEDDTIAALMTEDPLTLQPRERLDLVRALMISCRCRHLPVVDGERICGMVSARDLAGVALLKETEVRAIMHSPVETAPPDLSVERAVERLLARRFSSLPVVERERLIGIVTTTDFVRLACTRLGDEPVSRLMTPRPLVTVAPSQPLGVARFFMKAEHVRHLPVVDGDQLVGFLSDLDLLAAADAHTDLTVAEAMPRQFAAVAPEARASETGRLMVRDRLDAVPVIREGRLVGVLSVFDYLHYLLS